MIVLVATVTALVAVLAGVYTAVAVTLVVFVEVAGLSVVAIVYWLVKRPRW